ncbi:MAG TPA: DUF1080 domain-containing protein [Verrucomicrobiae bacterium]|nr:DUF1080 domain-containing protein [Verrucomicrobiae bacterium]
MKWNPVILPLALSLAALVSGCSALRPAAPVFHLLSQHRNDTFYTFLDASGKDNDPDHVFTLTNGVLRISGQHLGYIGTRQTNFANFKLIAEFRWGDLTWAPRQTNARDSGILIHLQGRDQVWPRSLEAQIIEGGTGDLLVVGKTFLTIDGKTKGPGIARFDRPGRNPWKDEKGFRGPHPIEQPTGEWNRMEILSDHGKVAIKVNGHPTLTGTNSIPDSGRIAVQSEGAEIYFRRLDLYPLK